MRKGWEIKKLREVCSKITDGSHNPPKGVDNSEFLMLSSKNIFNDLIHYDSPRFLTENDFINENKRTEVQYNDVLLTVVGTIGRVAVVPINHKKITLQRSVAVLRIREELLNSRFLMFSLQNILEFLTNEARGVAQKGIYLNQLKEIQIPIPPLSEQQRIVSILDEAFSSIEQAKENLQRNLQNAKELFQSELNSIFTNKGEGWEEKTLGEVCDELFAGGDAPKENFSLEKTEFNNIPIYANAVKDRGLYGFTNYARVTKPSISIAARGSGTGHTFLRQENYFPIVRLIVVIPNTELIDLSFLKLAIDTLVIVRSGSAIPQLTIPMIKNYTIPFPSLETQQKIVQQLDKLSTETKRLEEMYQQKLDALEELKKSILQKAFSGELSEN